MHTGLIEELIKYNCDLQTETIYTDELFWKVQPIGIERNTTMYRTKID